MYVYNLEAAYTHQHMYRYINVSIIFIEHCL